MKKLLFTFISFLLIFSTANADICEKWESNLIFSAWWTTCEKYINNSSDTYYLKKKNESGYTYSFGGVDTSNYSYYLVINDKEYWPYNYLQLISFWKNKDNFAFIEYDGKKWWRIYKNNKLINSWIQWINNLIYDNSWTNIYYVLYDENSASIYKNNELIKKYEDFNENIDWVDYKKYKIDNLKISNNNELSYILNKYELQEEKRCDSKWECWFEYSKKRFITKEIKENQVISDFPTNNNSVSNNKNNNNLKQNNLNSWKKEYYWMVYDVETKYITFDNKKYIYYEYYIWDLKLDDSTWNYNYFTWKNYYNIYIYEVKVDEKWETYIWKTVENDRNSLINKKFWDINVYSIYEDELFWTQNIVIWDKLVKLNMFITDINYNYSNNEIYVVWIGTFWKDNKVYKYIFNFSNSIILEDNKKQEKTNNVTNKNENIQNETISEDDVDEVMSIIKKEILNIEKDESLTKNQIVKRIILTKNDLNITKEWKKFILSVDKLNKEILLKIEQKVKVKINELDSVWYLNKDERNKKKMLEYIYFKSLYLNN